MPLEKTPENYSHCQLCHYQGKSKYSIIIHIQQSHKDTTFQKYYNRFFKEEKEGICEVCGHETKWNGKNYTKNNNRYYTTCCSVQCSANNPRFQEKAKDQCFQKYGVKHFTQRVDVRRKLTKTSIDNYSKSKRKREATIIQRYGSFENFHEFRLNRVKKTNLQRYGVEYPLLNKNIIQKTIIRGNITSKLHQRIKKILDLETLGFRSEQSIKNYYVDELNREKRIILEINGDYVHANPKFFQHNDVIKMKSHIYTAQEKWNYDFKRKLELAAEGFILFEVWSSDNLNQVKENLQIILEMSK